MKTRFAARYGDVRNHGWWVRTSSRFGYHHPVTWYETLVDKLVTAETRWIDVGGGKQSFPSNAELSAELARRCSLLVVVDPSHNVHSNELAHERAQCLIEDYQSDRRFDLATLRMVAEHVEQPERVLAALAKLIVPGGSLVIYTPNRWSPISVAATAMPFALHRRLAGVLWGAQEEDVFPTVYRMNTRRRLSSLLAQHGFRELAFAYIDSCTAFQSFRVPCLMELSLWRVLRTLGLHYPENELLGVYQRVETS
jgi:SAM-dependent methyltransferase